MKNKYKIECINKYKDFVNLEEDWDTLLQVTDVNSPFLTHGWQKAWLETYGNPDNILILVIKLNEELVGIVPFIYVRRNGFKVLELVGTGKSDWLDMPIVPNHIQNVLTEVIGFLLNEKKDWDIINFKDILEDSPAILNLEKVCKGYSIVFRKEIRTVSPYLRIGISWEEYLQSRSGHFRKQLRYHKRRAQRAVKDFQVVKDSDLNEDLSILSSMEQVEASSWKVESGTPKITTKLGKEFYKEFYTYFSEKGCIDIWIAKIGEQVIAYLLNIIYQNKCYSYNSAYNKKYSNLYIGSLLHSEAIQSSFENRLVEYNFLSGNESYKDKWCNDKQDIYQVVIFKKKIRSLIAFTILVKVRWILKKYDFFVKANQRFGSWKKRLILK